MCYFTDFIHFSDTQFCFQSWMTNLVFSLQGPFDVGFYEPLQLKILDLSGNELHTLHQDLFEHLPHLEQLYLKGNPFKILDKPTVIAISSLPNLKVNHQYNDHGIF